MILGDANETFVWSEGRAGGPVHNTARGSMLLQWMSDEGFEMPPQEVQVPSYYPHNQNYRPRRLDYVWTKGWRLVSEGKVREIRHVATSDHDMVTIPIMGERNARAP